MSQPITRRDALRSGALALTAVLLPGAAEAVAAPVGAAQSSSLAGSSAGPPYVAFFKLDAVKGESEQVGHEEWMDVLAWKWGVGQPGIRMTVGSRLSATPRAAFDPLTVFKAVDRASPIIFAACARAQRFKQAILHVVHTPGAGGDTTIAEYKLSSVIVTDVRTSLTPVGLDYPALTVDAPASGRPLESISLSYSRVEMAYWRVDPMTGSLDAAVTGGFDLTANKTIAILP